MSNDLAARVDLDVGHRLHRNHRRLLRTRFWCEIIFCVCKHFLWLDYLSVLASVCGFCVYIIYVGEKL